ncbi:MAG TPA: hypothetical protein VMG60_18775 [Burkholderiaceae bacterium]|nr:hypothetical protein [Burkholderiaceae bacterium]
MRNLAGWRRQAPHLSEQMMHVNVSGENQSRSELVPHVRDVLQRSWLPARLPTLEITETTLKQATFVECAVQL